MADLIVTAANVASSAGAVKKNGVAGAAILQGQAVVRNPANNKLVLSDSNHATAALRKVDGIALNAASDGQPLSYQSDGDINMGATLVAGTTYALSETAGGVQPVADLASGEQVTIIGTAKSTSILALSINDTGAVL